VVAIRFSDGEMVKFKMDVNPKSSLLYPFGEHRPCTVGYLPMGTIQGTLEALDAVSSVMCYEPKFYHSFYRIIYRRNWV
jgi:hypothetical protein